MVNRSSLDMIVNALVQDVSAASDALDWAPFVFRPATLVIMTSHGHENNVKPYWAEISSGRGASSKGPPW